MTLKEYKEKLNEILISMANRSEEGIQFIIELFELNDEGDESDKFMASLAFSQEYKDEASVLHEFDKKSMGELTQELEVHQLSNGHIVVLF